jgi:hypothetical protein
MSNTTAISPIVLDSTGQAIVLKLEAIKTAIENGGGGGGGSAPQYLLVKAYDTTIKRHGQYQWQSYCVGDYCIYEGTVYRAIADISYADPTSTFNSANWEEIVDLPLELSSKPGKRDPIINGEVFNDYVNNTASSSYCHAEGYNCRATNSYCHAEGNNTQAKSPNSHSEGYSTEANGQASHTEGYQTKTKGDGAHAGGQYCEANANGSFAHGFSVIANGTNEFAIGKYNKRYINGDSYSYFSSSNYYYTGDQVIVGTWIVPNQHNVYQANTDISPGNFDATQWDIVGEYTYDSNIPLLSVGNGSSSADQYRKNAFEVFKNDTAKLGGKTVLAIDPPTVDGTYTLKCTVSSGSVSYAWVADT